MVNVSHCCTLGRQRPGHQAKQAAAPAAQLPAVQQAAATGVRGSPAVRQARRLWTWAASRGTTTASLHCPRDRRAASASPSCPPRCAVDARADDLCSPCVAVPAPWVSERAASARHIREHLVHFETQWHGLIIGVWPALLCGLRSPAATGAQTAGLRRHSQKSVLLCLASLGDEAG